MLSGHSRTDFKNICPKKQRDNERWILRRKCLWEWQEMQKEAEKTESLGASENLFTSRDCMRGMNVVLCTWQTVGSDVCVYQCVCEKRKRELRSPSPEPTDVWSCIAHPRPPQAASSCCQRETGRPGETGRGPMGRKQERASFTAWYVLLDPHTMYPLRTLKNNI